MAKAVWNGAVIADSDRSILVEGNIYFSPDSVKQEYLRSSPTQYTCPWKGETAYYDIVVEGKVNKDAAWSYPEPKEAAMVIKGYVAFGGGVEVTGPAASKFERH